MQLKVQKSSSTTRPRRSARDSGRPPGTLNQRWVPTISGAAPRSGSRAPAATAAGPMLRGEPPGPRPCSPPRRSARASRIAPLRSRPAVGVTIAAGSSSAIAVWKRRSRSATIATASATITAPIACWKRPLRRDRGRVSRRPPSISRCSTTPVPAP